MEELDNEKIGIFLKRLRLRIGYTQADLGMFINVSDKAVSRWESGLGTPELGNLRMLAKLYNISIDDILSCNDDVFCERESDNSVLKSAQNISETNTLRKEKESEQRTAQIFNDNCNICVD